MKNCNICNNEFDGDGTACSPACSMCRNVREAKECGCADHVVEMVTGTPNKVIARIVRAREYCKSHVQQCLDDLEAILA